MTDRLGARRTARLARYRDLAPGGAKRCRQFADLGRLAGPFPAFKGYEQSTHRYSGYPVSKQAQARIA
jgi:hypothetical protein